MPRTKAPPLNKFYNEDSELLEIGIDEAGRGPLFGRVYTGAVILPKDVDFDFDKMKDSKKFNSNKKINEVAEYIKEKALAWSVTYNDETVIDNINIRQSVLGSMHNSIKNVMTDDNEYLPINHICIEGGDNKYCAIAAASILAKTERDKYIEELCEENPELKEKYSIDKNKGYGTRKHLDGINNFGITKWHRKTYGICKHYC